MATLTGKTPKDTYGGLLKVSPTGLVSTLQTVEDGFGHASPLQLSTTAFAIHNLTFPSTNALPGRVLAVSEDGLSMVWVDAGGSSSPTAKGTIQVSDGTSLVSVAVGSNGQVLTADSTQASGVKWATPASGGSGEALADSATYTYNADNAIDTVTEDIGGNTRTSVYTYNGSGAIETVTTTYLGVTRQETYTYVDGRISTMTATIL